MIDCHGWTCCLNDYGTLEIDNPTPERVLLLLANPVFPAGQRIGPGSLPNQFRDYQGRTGGMGLPPSKPCNVHS